MLCHAPCRAHLVRLLVSKAHNLVLNGGAVAGALGIHPAASSDPEEILSQEANASAWRLAQRRLPWWTRSDAAGQAAVQGRQAGRLRQPAAAASCWLSPAVNGRLVQVLLQEQQGDGGREEGVQRRASREEHPASLLQRAEKPDLSCPATNHAPANTPATHPQETRVSAVKWGARICSTTTTSHQVAKVPPTRRMRCVSAVVWVR